MAPIDPFLHPTRSTHDFPISLLFFIVALMGIFNILLCSKLASLERSQQAHREALRGIIERAGRANRQLQRLEHKHRNLQQACRQLQNSINAARYLLGWILEKLQLDEWASDTGSRAESDLLN